MNRISEILEPTEEQKERMFSNILNKHEKQSIKKRGFAPTKRLRPGLVAVVMVLCLITTTAIAAVYGGLDVEFLNFLNPLSNEQTEYLANGAYIVDKQVKNKNGILDIKQVIGDSNVTLILMDFTAPKGTILNKPHYSFKDIDFDFGNGFAGYGIISLKDENIEDNKISMVMRLKTNESLIGQKLHLELTDLNSFDTIPGEPTIATSGKWKTSFRLNFKNYSNDHQVDKEIKMFDYDATINTISISPISVALKLESPFTKEISKASGNWEELGPDVFSDIYPITINYKDGTSETTDIFNGMHHLEYSSGNMLFIKTFENVINDKEIESITFFETEINLPNN